MITVRDRRGNPGVHTLRSAVQDKVHRTYAGSPAGPGETANTTSMACRTIPLCPFYLVLISLLP